MSSLSLLPPGWAKVTIGDLFMELRAKVSADPKSSLPFIGMDHVESETMRLLGAGLFSEMKSAGTRFHSGDVLYGRLRPYLNKVHHADFEGVSSAEFLVFPQVPTILNSYLKFVLTDRAFVAFASHPDNVTGDRPRIDFDTLKKYQIALPPTAEQVRIVSRIEELFSDLDKGEENLRRAQAQLKRYRQSVLKAAVAGELTRDWREKNADKLESGAALLKRILKARREAWEKAELEKLCAKGRHPKSDAWKARYVEPQGPNTEELPGLPEGWAWVSLEQLSWASCYGTSTKCSYEGAGIGVLRIPNIRFGMILENDIKYSVAPLELPDEELLQRGDLLIIRTNGSEDIVGTGAVVTGPLKQRFYFASYAIRFRLVLPDVLSRYMNFYLDTEAARKFIRQIKATSAGQYNVSQSNLARMPVALPPIAEVPEVISAYEETLSNAKAIDLTLETGLKQSRALRQSILKAAFSGKLVPQDPSDEPVEELLKQIAAERAAQREKQGKGAAGRGPRKTRPAKLATRAVPAASGLAAARKAAGFSQAKLAKATGINQAYVSQMENGKRPMTDDQAAAIAKALGIAPADLVQK